MTYMTRIPRAGSAQVDPQRIAEARAMADDMRHINAIDAYLIGAPVRPQQNEPDHNLRRAFFIVAAFLIGIVVGAYAVHADPLGRLAADLERIEAMK